MNSYVLANSFFEEEKEHPIHDLMVFLRKHPLHMQLHFLSLLTSSPQTIALCAFPPPPSYLKHIHSLGFTPYYQILSDPLAPISLRSWGTSPALSSLAKQRNLLYHMPESQIAYLVNSKAFSFTHSPPLPGAMLVTTPEELSLFWNHVKGPKVLKSLQGSAGRGHCLPTDLTQATQFLQKHKEGVLAEPWVKRAWDFSSQWHISQQGKIEYLGSTLCGNSPRGTYRQSIAGPESIVFQGKELFLEKHVEHAQPLLIKIAQQGFFGHLGIDAMVYWDQENLCLHPIVELNARQTMGYVALCLYKNRAEPHAMVYSYTPRALQKQEHLLPSSLMIEGSCLTLPGVFSMRPAKPEDLIAFNPFSR